MAYLEVWKPSSAEAMGSVPKKGCGCLWLSDYLSDNIFDYTQ